MSQDEISALTVKLADKDKELRYQALQLRARAMTSVSP